MPGIKTINCPTCQKIVPWTEEQVYRPFCSKKCQMIDFGEWASERHAIPAEDPPDGFEDLDDDLKQ
jgi:endogenous inhibitor of DNA gyrase (YacG/DUF329 family)